MRIIHNINQGWRFSLTADAVSEQLPADWEEINLPHTWNGIDGQDGGGDYHRGVGYYAKMIPASRLRSPVNFLQFEGVNSTAKVFWNGRQIFTHFGGYSTFRMELDDIREENLLVVTADNTPNDNVYPQNADFTFYGGIYRDVSISVQGLSLHRHFFGQGK